MWVTKDNEIISDAEPDSDGFMEVRRPCPDCLGSGINCLQCAGSGSLPPVMEKVYPVYEWASKNSLQMPFKSPEQALIKSFLKVILEAPNQGKSNFYSALIQKLDKSYFPTKLQFRCLKPNGYGVWGAMEPKTNVRVYHRRSVPSSHAFASTLQLHKSASRFISDRS